MRPEPQASDLELIRGYQRDPNGRTGREAAAALLERYAERIYLWCFRMTRDHARAVDLAQDAALEVLTSLHQFRGEASVSTWLYSVTRHRCLRAFRRPSLFTDEVEDLDALPASGPSLEDQVELRLETEDLLTLMREALQPDESTALWMRCVEGMSIPDINRLLGLTNASGARGLLQTARRKLRSAREARTGPRAIGGDA
jgi:RNA polymerase sigma-70 factor (ECF subfamily)